MAKKFSIKAVFEVVDKFTTPFKKMGRSIGALIKPINKVRKSLRNMGKGLDKVGKKMTTHLTLPIAGFGALTIRTTARFQESMNKVVAVTSATGKSLEDLTKLAKDLGSTTQFSASQAANAMTFLGMAGLNTKQIMEALPGTLQLAAAGGMDLAQAADIATNIMTAMGKEAKELGSINNILAETAKSANTNITQLAEAMSPVAPIARKLGIELPQMSAMLGKMADQGVRGGRAGTFLRNALLNVVNPSNKLIKLFSRLRINIKDFVTDGGEIKNFEVLLKQLEERGATAGEIMQAFGERGGQAIALLTAKGKSAKDIAAFTKQIEGATTAAADMEKAMKKGLPGAMKELSSAFEGLQLAISESGFGQFVEKVIRDLSDFIRELSKTNPEIMAFITILAGVVAVIGPLLVGLGFVATAMAAISLPVVIAVAAIVGLAMVALLIVKHWKPIKQFFINMWNDIIEFTKQVGEVLFELLVQPFINFGEAVSSIFFGIKNAIKDLLGFLPEAIQKKLGFKTTVETRAFDEKSIGRTVGQNSQAEVTVKVVSEAGTTATIDKVKKRGAGKVKVQNESIFGFTNEFGIQ